MRLPSWLTASAVTAIVSILVTIWDNRRSALRSMRPLLVMDYRQDGWYVQNVGTGPAVDVLFARKRPGADWFDPVRLPPIARDGEFFRRWAAHDRSWPRADLSRR